MSEGPRDGVFFVRQATILLMHAKLKPHSERATHLWRISPDVRAAIASLASSELSAPSPLVGARLLGYPVAVDDGAQPGTLELKAIEA